MLAITDPEASPSRGMTGFIVDADTDGIILGKKEINMGMSFFSTFLGTDSCQPQYWNLT